MGAVMGEQQLWDRFPQQGQSDCRALLSVLLLLSCNEEK